MAMERVELTVDEDGARAEAPQARRAEPEGLESPGFGY